MRLRPDTTRMRGSTRGQGYVEFGVTVAVVVLVALMGLDQMQVSVHQYFTGEGMTHAINPPTPTSASGAPPPRRTNTFLTCASAVFENSQPTLCTARVQDDSASPDPTWRPNGTVYVETNAVGLPDGSSGVGELFLPGDSPPYRRYTTCTLAADGGNGTACQFNYYPTWSGKPLGLVPYRLNEHTLTSTFTPAANPPALASLGKPLTQQVKRLTTIDLDPVLDCKAGAGAAALPVGDASRPLIVTQTAATCTPRIFDTDNKIPGSNPPEENPVGTVNWRIYTPPNLTEAAGTCPTTTCQFVYTAPAWDGGTHIPDIRYMPVGDPYHSTQTCLVSGIAKPIFVADHTATQVQSCVPPASVQVNHAISCDVEVRNQTGNRTPTGDVRWSMSDASTGVTSEGTFSVSTCHLIQLTPGLSHCDVTVPVNYTPSTIGSGTHVIIATYNAPYTTTLNGFESTSDGRPLTVVP